MQTRLEQEVEKLGCAVRTVGEIQDGNLSK